VILDGSFGGAEGESNLAVAVPARHETHDLGFPCGELFPRRLAIEAHGAAGTQQPLGHGRLKHGRSPGDRADRRE